MSDRCACYDTLVVKDLNRWFKEKWVDVSRKDKDGKHPPCGRSKASKSSKGYPKCRPSVKVSGKTPKTSGSMSEGEKRAATKRKRSKKQGVGGKPTIVKATYQSNLGEHHDDFPSPYGPVVGYHGTTGDNFMDIMAGSGLRNPDPNYRHITTSPSEAATYALQRSGGNRGVVDWQSQPKLIGVRQAAFDQNHPNYIGPSHGLKNSDDYQGAQHYGGNIPRQFLTSTPMSNEILGDTMQARDDSQYIIDRNMSYPAESTDHARRRFQERQDTSPTQSPIVNQRGEVKPEKPQYSALGKWRSGYAEKYQQRMDNYNQQMAQYMQPNPVQQPIDPQQQQLDVQFEQPQMIQQGEPMDMAWRLLKMPLDWDSFDDEEKKINWIDPSDGRVIQLDGEVSRQYFNGEPQEELDVSMSNDKGETIGHAGVTPYHESEEDWQYNPHQKHTVFPRLDKDFQGRGLGADLYHFITALGYPIIADHNNQSPQAQRMWMRNQGASEWGTKDAKGAEWKLKRDDL